MERRLRVDVVEHHQLVVFVDHRRGDLLAGNAAEEARAHAPYCRMQGVNPTRRDELLAQVTDLRWYHTIDLGGGVVTRGVDDTPLRLSRLQFPRDLTGKSVLDIGAWDGFYSFEAERRGAARVVATDHYAWHGTGWGTGKGKAGFELARTVLGSRVEDVDVDVMSLSPDKLGTFDVVLFLGVLYHVPDPLAALERVSAMTADLLIVETVI